MISARNRPEQILASKSSKFSRRFLLVEDSSNLAFLHVEAAAKLVFGHL